VTGYTAANGFFRTNQLDTLSSLTSIPVANLLLILVSMPLVALFGGWLLTGPKPRAIGHCPLEQPAGSTLGCCGGRAAGPYGHACRQLGAELVTE
jgi:hypothetical protein